MDAAGSETETSGTMAGWPAQFKPSLRSCEDAGIAPGRLEAMVLRMTLQAWSQAGWLRKHDTQPAEIGHLREVVTGDLADAESLEHTPAVRFEYAYNAALKACIIALYAEDLRPGAVSDVHHTIIRSLPLTLGPDREVAADYLDACRERRDRLECETEAAKITDEDAAALLEFSRELCAAVDAWLRERHPDLVPE